MRCALVQPERRRQLQFGESINRRAKHIATKATLDFGCICLTVWPASEANAAYASCIGCVGSHLLVLRQRELDSDSERAL